MKTYLAYFQLKKHTCVKRSEEHRHKSEKKISRKLRKTKTFIFENFQESQLQNAVQRWVLGNFECGFRGSGEKHVEKPIVP